MFSKGKHVDTAIKRAFFSKKKNADSGVRQCFQKENTLTLSFFTEKNRFNKRVTDRIFCEGTASIVLAASVGSRKRL